jgi:hypothetical protein
MDNFNKYLAYQCRQGKNLQDVHERIAVACKLLGYSDALKELKIIDLGQWLTLHNKIMTFISHR